ncbi:restriction endonuclease subunit S [Pectobacterium colocasium]|uniref:restriction endonuclease subunit S n=1 Tax=Pectobacterium TaxID=122277 RepID=UPI003D72B83E
MQNPVTEKQQSGATGKAVPAGYKLTEVGVIPEDWLVISIDGCTTKVGSGKTPTGGASIYVDSGRPFVRSQNIDWGRLDLTDVAHITDDIHNTFSGSEIQQDDVLLNITGASIGRCAKADFRIAGGNVNQHVCIIRTDAKKLKPSLLVELINSNFGQKQIDSYQAGGNREGLNFSQVKSLKFAIASNETEQATIAKALTDVNDCIITLVKLLTKKQAIKSAAMQQLLTGKTRLPQFALREDGTVKGYKKSELGEIPEDWNYVEFGNLFEPTVIKKTLNDTEEVSFIGMQDVSDSAKLSTYLLMKKCDIKPGLTYFERGDVLVAKITPCFENGKGCHTEMLRTNIGYGSTEFHVLRAKKNVESAFIYYWTTNIHFRSTLKIDMVGSAGHKRVPFQAIQSYKMQCPENKQEQTAIAAILSDMDQEIQTLQQRLEKTRQLKQGMMQELLTGKTRLI